MKFSPGCSQIRHLLYSDEKQVETSRKAHTKASTGQGVTLRGGRRAPGILSHSSLSEVVGTLMGDHVPGLVKGIHNSRLQRLFLSSGQVLFQLLQAGHAQNDRVPLGALQGETARSQHTLLVGGSCHMPLFAYPLGRSGIFVYFCPGHPGRTEDDFASWTYMTLFLSLVTGALP